MAKKEKIWKVTEAFKDTDEHVYEAKQRYPFPANKKIHPERIKELSTKGNKYGRPFIKLEDADETDKD